MKSSTFLQLTGLPRSGSTLLAAMLSQHPDVHVGGTSALCDLLNSVCHACDSGNLAYELLQANRRYAEVRKESVEALYNVYYGAVDTRFILDRGRGWPHEYNMQIVRDYINPNPKAILLVRPIEEIVRSFVALRMRAGEDHNIYDELLEPNTTPIMIPYAFVRQAVFSRSPEFLVITYNDLVQRTGQTLDMVFAHYGLSPAEIDFEKFSEFCVEDDSAYPFQNLHELRGGVSTRENPVILPQDVQEYCEQLTRELYLDLPSWGAEPRNIGVV